TVVGLVNNKRNTNPDTSVATQNLDTSNTTARTNAPDQRYDTAQTAANEQVALNDQNVSADYRAGFTDGFNAAREGVTASRTTVVGVPTTSRVVYRSTPVRTRYGRSSRTAYYDYTPRHRSFWQKHRDKLTVAMGTGGGALLGGLGRGRTGAVRGA